MSELRQNFATKEWVVIATERARRPEEMARHSERKPAAPFVANCPFCPGNEKLTPPEIMRIPTSLEVPWHARVIPNKFAALSRDVQPTRTVHRSRRSVNGFGVHDVIVETPDHSQVMALMSDSYVTEILRIYKSRYDALSLDPRIALITIFKNHGIDAGTSLEHPHSQIIATPVISLQVRERFQQALRHFDDFGECMFCQMLEEELQEQTRIVSVSETFRRARTLCLVGSVLHPHLSAAAHGELRRCEHFRTQRSGAHVALDSGQALPRAGRPGFQLYDPKRSRRERRREVLSLVSECDPAADASGWI